MPPSALLRGASLCASGHGSMATIVILLLWFFLSGIAILIGGEVNSEIERALGSAQPEGRADSR